MPWTGAAGWKELCHLFGRGAKQTAGIALGYAHVLEQHAGGIGESLPFGIGRFGGAPSCLQHTVQQRRDFRNHQIHGNRVGRNGKDRGDGVARHVLGLVERASLGVDVERCDVDGPPPAHSAEQRFIGGTHRDSTSLMMSRP